MGSILLTTALLLGTIIITARLHRHFSACLAAPEPEPERTPTPLQRYIITYPDGTEVTTYE